LSTVATRTWRVGDKGEALNECEELLLADRRMGTSETVETGIVLGQLGAS